MDYFKSSNKTIVSNAKEIHGVSLNLDHRMVVTKLKLKTSESNLCIRKKSQRRSLREQKTTTVSRRRINENVSEWEERGEEECSKVDDCLKEVAVEVLGRRDGRGRKEKTHLFVYGGSKDKKNENMIKENDTGSERGVCNHKK